MVKRIVRNMIPSYSYCYHIYVYFYLFIFKHKEAGLFASLYPSSLAQSQREELI